MESNTEWLMSFVPTVIGAIIVAVALLSSTDSIVSGYLRLVSITSLPTNLIRNAVDVLKYFAGPGG